MERTFESIADAELTPYVPIGWAVTAPKFRHGRYENGESFVDIMFFLLKEPHLDAKKPVDVEEVSHCSSIIRLKGKESGLSSLTTWLKDVERIFDRMEEEDSVRFSGESRDRTASGDSAPTGVGDGQELAEAVPEDRERKESSQGSGGPREDNVGEDNS